MLSYFMFFFSKSHMAILYTATCQNFIFFFALNTTYKVLYDSCKMYIFVLLHTINLFLRNAYIYIYIYIYLSLLHMIDLLLQADPSTGENNHYIFFVCGRMMRGFLYIGFLSFSLSNKLKEKKKGVLRSECFPSVFF